MSQIQLILGGARSGKSSLAERYAKACQLPVTYIATAQALDDEMQQRISRHQQDRPIDWRLVETPTMLAAAIESASAPHHCLLIDCLTLWLSNCLCQFDSDYWQQQKQQLIGALQRSAAIDNLHIILVSNEVGHGIVPLGDLSREFVDQAGWLHQELALLANSVDFVIAGLPLRLKPQAIDNINININNNNHNGDNS